MSGIPFRAQVPELNTSKEHLLELLELLDMTNTDLARLCDVDRTTVQRWLNGSHPIQHAALRMLEMMAELKGITSRTRVYWNEPASEPKERT